MRVRDLNREQLNELKQHYICEQIDNPSYLDLANAEDIPDEIIYDYYDFVHFVSDDFSC